jgi:hypothetical protein
MMCLSNTDIVAAMTNLEAKQKRDNAEAAKDKKVAGLAGAGRGNRTPFNHAAERSGLKAD